MVFFKKRLIIEKKDQERWGFYMKYFSKGIDCKNRKREKGVL